MYILMCILKTYLADIWFFRCMAAPVSFDFERTVSSSHQTGNIELSTGKLELNEYLFKRSSTSLPTPAPYSTTQVIGPVNCRALYMYIVSFHV